MEFCPFYGSCKCLLYMGMGGGREQSGHQFDADSHNWPLMGYARLLLWGVW